MRNSEGVILESSSSKPLIAPSETLMLLCGHEPSFLAEVVGKRLVKNGNFSICSSSDKEPMFNGRIRQRGRKQIYTASMTRIDTVKPRYQQRRAGHPRLGYRLTSFEEH